MNQDLLTSLTVILRSIVGWAFVVGASLVQFFRERFELMFEFFLSRLQTIDLLILFDHDSVQLFKFILQMSDQRFEMDNFFGEIFGIRHE